MSSYHPARESSSFPARESSSFGRATRTSHSAHGVYLDESDDEAPITNKNKRPMYNEPRDAPLKRDRRNVEDREGNEFYEDSVLSDADYDERWQSMDVLLPSPQRRLPSPQRRLPSPQRRLPSPQRRLPSSPDEYDLDREDHRLRRCAELGLPSTSTWEELQSAPYDEDHRVLQLRAEDLLRPARAQPEPAPEEVRYESDPEQHFDNSDVYDFWAWDNEPVVDPKAAFSDFTSTQLTDEAIKLKVDMHRILAFARNDLSRDEFVASIIAAMPNERLCMVCLTNGSVAFTCNSSAAHACCRDCEKLFVKNAFDLTPAQLRGSLPCITSGCKGRIEAIQLAEPYKVELLDIMSRPFEDAIKPKDLAYYIGEFRAALLLKCPGNCARVVENNPAGCNHFYCAHPCDTSFCGCCLKIGCKDSHNESGNIYCKKSRFDGQAKVKKLQLKKAWNLTPAEFRSPMLAAVTQDLTKGDEDKGMRNFLKNLARPRSRAE